MSYSKGSAIVFALLNFTSMPASAHAALPQSAHPVNQTLDLQSLAQADGTELSTISNRAVVQAGVSVRSILNTDPQTASFAESFGAYDQARMRVLEALHFVELVSLVSPDSVRRAEAKDLAVNLRRALREVFDDQLSSHLLKCGEKLRKNLPSDSEEKQLIDFVQADLQHQGIGLSEEKRKRLRELQAEIADLSATFDKNVQDIGGKVEATLEELEGVDSKLLSSLKKRESDGRYLLGTDYPTVHGVLRLATSSSLRRRVFLNFNNRAYPDNYKVLNRLRESREEMAQLLGFASFAEFDLADQMSGEPEKVKTFLDSLVPSAKKRSEADLAKLLGVSSAQDRNEFGQFFAWSFGYLRDQYAKKELGLDLSKVAEFFPVDKTLAGLFSILEKQFGIQVTLSPDSKAWDSEVKVATVTFEGKVRGQVYLDLYPREGKYTHGRVMVIRPTRQTHDENQSKDQSKVSSKDQGTVPSKAPSKNQGEDQGKDQDLIPGQVAILTNFTRPQPGQPALFKFGEVTTLFHEFGHALHALLIDSKYSFMDSGEMAITYGLPLKTDFVELPSQMLELWLRDPDLVRSLSSHYKTGASLPPETVQALISQQDTFRGIDLLSQVSMAKLSLELFSQNESVDALLLQLQKELKPYQALDVDSHHPASFLHLTSYGAKYYSYLWTQVFALDLFDAFKKTGLLSDQNIGKKYCREVLAKGGSIHPAQLLEDFLGRPVSPDSFLQSLRKGD